MARPVVSAIAEEMYEALLPLAYEDEKHDWALLHFCEAYIGKLQEVEDLIRDTDAGPGWSSIVDVDRAPYKGLPWLGQLVGLTTPDRLVGETELAHETRIRDYVRSTGGFSRGTRAAIIGAAQQHLTGTKTVIVTERYGGAAYQLRVRTWNEETPVEDWSTTNLLTNSGFETNTSGWTQNAATLSRDTAQAKSGIASGKVVTNGSAATYRNMEGAMFGGIAASPGLAYTASSYFKAPAASRLIVLMNFYSAANVWLGEVFTRLDGTNNWQRPSVSAIAPANTAYIDLYLVTYDYAQAITFHIDDVQVEQNSSATPVVHTDGAVASRPPGQGLVGAAIAAQKPAGIVLDYAPVPKNSYDAIDASYASYDAIDAAHTSYDDIDT